ncbi:MAG: hypothetical protein HGA78_01205 [Nitrospirales bacterium]|nr:hypothetical protein [Nitrospirales bacterium]
MQVEIFKTGTHTDSAGRSRTWTEADLDTIVARYNPSEHEAPVVIGHPQDNAPAYGWVEGLKREGQTLYATFKDLVPEFVEVVKKGMYKKRSISLYPDLTLRHVGFLGAMPPAVKGLADVAFAEPGAATIEFADLGDSIVGNVFRRLREWLIEKFDPDTADRVVGNGEIEELQREDRAEVEAQPAFSEKVEGPGSGGQGPEENKEAEMEKMQELEGKLSEFAEREKSKDAKIAALEAEARRTRNASFCEGLMREGKVTPAMLPNVLDFMEILSSSGEFEFSEGEGKSKAQPVERFKAFLQGLPKQVEFSEVATKDKAVEQAGGTAGQRIEAKVREKMQGNKDLSYTAAFSEVQRENPELAVEYSAEIGR